MLYWLKPVSKLNEFDFKQIDMRIREIENELETEQPENEFISLDAERYELMRLLGES